MSTARLCVRATYFAPLMAPSQLPAVQLAFDSVLCTQANMQAGTDLDGCTTTPATEHCGSDEAAMVACEPLRVVKPTTIGQSQRTCQWYSVSPCHIVTLSHCHPATLSPCHIVTLSPCHIVTLSHCHPVTLSPCHIVTLSHCHPVTLSPCHIVTLSHCHPVGAVACTACHPVTLSPCRCRCAYRGGGDELHSRRAAHLLRQDKV